jgi:predicted dehydrogenase
MQYAPDTSGIRPVVKPGEFVFAASHFDHGHIYGQIDGLARAGGVLKSIYEPDARRHKDLLKNHPGCRAVNRFEDILEDRDVQLVTSAAIPNERCGIGLQVLASGKEYFTDKSPFTSLAQLEQARRQVQATGRRYMVCYSERLLNEAAWHAGILIAQGAIGRVLQVLNLAPHNLAAESRPAWFFEKARYGGILTDIGSHQFEQFLAYAGARDGTVRFARVENMANPQHPGLEDFGEAALELDTGASAYCRLDWFNPKASRTWGDGRTFVLGTDGYLEIRKNINVARPDGGNRIYLVNGEAEQEIDCSGAGFPFFGQYVLDVLAGTEKAMTQAHAFKAAELSMLAQRMADERRGLGEAGARA